MAGSGPPPRIGMSASEKAEPALRSYLRAEQIKLPLICHERSLLWIAAFAA